MGSLGAAESGQTDRYWQWTQTSASPSPSEIRGQPALIQVADTETSAHETQADALDLPEFDVLLRVESLDMEESNGDVAPVEYQRAEASTECQRSRRRSGDRGKASPPQ